MVEQVSSETSTVDEFVKIVEDGQRFNQVDRILNQMLHVRNTGGPPSKWIVLRTFGGYLDYDNARLLRDWLNKALP